MTARRERFLRAMGISPRWRLRATDAVSVSEEVAAPAESDAQAVKVAQMSEQASRSVAEGVPSAAPVPVRPPQGPLPVKGADGGGEAQHYASAGPVDTLDWEALEAAIAGCRACRLCEGRRQAVPGSGDRQARLMLVGEGPGAEEDRRGLPFVGAAGSLLDAMLAAIGLDREHEVYIANTVKCRPPFNRTPEDDEMAACAPFLERQIELVEPDLIVALGRPAAQRLLGQPVRINAVRGRTWSYEERIPVVVTYHPAYLLRNPEDKAKAWSDLCLVRQVLDS